MDRKHIVAIIDYTGLLAFIITVVSVLQGSVFPYQPNMFLGLIWGYAAIWTLIHVVTMDID